MSDKRPNVLIILADDLGFSDIGCYGSEIQTPNIDRLAREGLRFTDFHTAAACSPTRSMLLSGTDHHIAGIGAMAERLTPEIRGKPGYEGYLNDRVVSLPEALRGENGQEYETFMSGKWHLGMTTDRSPHARGFDRSFALMGGAHNHYGWEPTYEDPSTIPRIIGVLSKMYQRDEKPLSPHELPKNFYSTDSFTDELLGYLKDRQERSKEEEEEEDGKKPFFAYLPYSAPHWPLQAPLDVVAKYRGLYDDGFEALRQKRLASMKSMGLVSPDAIPAPVVSKGEDGKDTPEWDELSPLEKQQSARKMEVYAAMVDHMDRNIGRVLDHLESTNELDNTIVMFMSDNGAEGAQFEATPLTAGGDMDAYAAKYHDNSLNNLGAYDSFVWYGARWASASTAPGFLYKMFTSEGGIRVPLVVRYPKLINTTTTAAPDKKEEAGMIKHEFCTVMDIMPTILELCSTPQPGATFRGREGIAPIAGKSWVPFLSGNAAKIHEEDHVTGWELFGRRAVRKGSCKALYIPKPHGPEKWQLFNILDDPGETRDLAEEMGTKMEEMIGLYEEYCKRNGVLSLGTGSRSNWS